MKYVRRRADKHARKYAIAAAILLGAASPSWASGALWCNLDDANMKLDISSGVTHGLGGPLFNFEASAVLKDKRVMPELRKLKLDDKLVHHWLNGNVKLSFYSETEQNANIYSVEILVEADPVPEEDGYAGTYRIISYAPAKEGEDGRLELTGPITCGGE